MRIVTPLRNPCSEHTHRPTDRFSSCHDAESQKVLVRARLRDLGHRLAPCDSLRALVKTVVVACFGEADG